MTYNQLRNLAYGLLALKQIHGWRRLFEYSKASIGLRILTSADLPPKATVLVIAPHADDEVFGCGGTLAALIANGASIHVLYLTDGANGTPDGQREPGLVATRQKEAKAGLAILGGGQTIFWDYADGNVRPTPEKIKALQTLIDQLQPTHLFVPWQGDTHLDHQMAFELLLAALKNQSNLKAEVWQYEVWAPLLPNRIIDINQFAKAKQAAIQAHQSQLTSHRYEVGIQGLNTYRGAVAKTPGPAEAFFALPVKQFLDFSRTKE